MYFRDSQLAKKILVFTDLSKKMPAALYCTLQHKQKVRLSMHMKNLELIPAVWGGARV